GAWSPRRAVRRRHGNAKFLARGGEKRRRLLDGARGQAGDVVVEEEDVEDDDGHGAEDGPRHERAPEIDVAADQLAGDTHAGRELLRRGCEGQSVDELV